jgi:hypothetical protein
MPTFSKPCHVNRRARGRGLVPVSAGFSEVGVPLEAFDEVLDVGYLEELSENQGFEVLFGLVLPGSSWAFCVEVRPEDGVDRS